MFRKLASIDLNLLLVLDTLLVEKNVTRAAHRLNMTQSAVSNALNRLRRIFQDPLLVRGKAAMMPTPLAANLAGPLRDSLTTLDRTLRNGLNFEADSARELFQVGMFDYGEAVILPSLARHLAAYAPGIRLSVTPLSKRHTTELLVDGAIDLAITGYSIGLGQHLLQQKLLQDDFVCIARREHPLSGKTLSVEDYCRSRHLIVSLVDGEMSNAVDEELAGLGRQRDVVIAVPHFLVAADMIAETDWLATVPRRIAAPWASTGRCVSWPLPLEGIRFTLCQVWHARTDADPAARWLRHTLHQICSDLG